MTNNSDKSGNILQDNNATYQEPPPPYTPGGSSLNTNSSHEIFYEGDATEHSRLLSNNNTTSSYTLSRQPTIKKSQRNTYLPTPNFSYIPSGASDRYHQQPETTLFRSIMPLENLSTMPAITICPHCNNIVLSYIQYKSGSCTWLSCFLLSHTLVAVCFIPFCVDDLKDVIHYCSNCDKTMAIYSRLNDKTCKYNGH